jgi:tetratricopeptide (TPR) repeat protein
LLALFLVVGPASFTQTVDEPAEEASPEQYIQWLRNNPGHPEFAQLLDRYVLREDDVLRLEASLSQLAPDVSAMLPKTIHYLARLAELRGQLEQALSFYKSLMDAEDPPALVVFLDAARLYYQIGERDEARSALVSLQDQLDAADPLLPDAALLEAIITLEEDESAGVVKLESVSADYRDTPAAARALLALYDHHRENPHRAAIYSRALRLAAPHSPEAALIGGSATTTPSITVEYLLSPNRLFALLDRPASAEPHPDEHGEPTTTRSPAAPGAPTPYTPAHSSGKLTTDSTRYHILLGSFTVRENANYMQRDVTRAGFEVTIRTVTLRGTIYHRVLLADSYDSPGAQSALIRLKDAGFEGTLVAVDPAPE